MVAKLSNTETFLLKLIHLYLRKDTTHSFQITFDSGTQPTIGTSKKVIKVTILDSQNTLQRIMSQGSIGLGEVYCEGKIVVKDIAYKYFLMVFVSAIHDPALVLKVSPLTVFHILKAKFAGSAFGHETQDENINSHYSLSQWFDNDTDSNEFYMLWLNSKYIQYTCAKWDHKTKNLEEAQKNKFEFYAKRLGITKKSAGKTLLDLGCGWGGFMFYLAEKYGIKCTGITLSTAQATYIKAEAKKRNMIKDVSVQLKNIHDMTGQWDYLISIGVLEHIKDFDDLYKKSSNALKPKGRLLFHSMYQKNLMYKPDPFLLKYIFPGGAIPHLPKNIRIFKKYFKTVKPNALLERSYPKTLDCWFSKFCKNEKEIRALLIKSGKCKDVDFAIRIFKHYLTLANCGLIQNGLVVNVLAYN
jgi:cyclopropane-fatty-acyl-phospholipid synthase